MRKNYTLKFTAAFAVFCMLLFAGTDGYAQIAKPANLKADVLGTRVALTWESGTQGTPLNTNNFEQSEFPGNGWTVKTTNATDYKCSWFHFPTDEVKENLEDWQVLLYEGEGSAVVMSDAGYHEDASYFQDEWLISPDIQGAVSLDFNCFIHPMILEYGQYEEFADHYCVKISHDGGETWETVWDARYDAAPVETYQQVSIPLEKVDGNTRIAFQAISNEEYQEPLYFTWAIDNIVISGSEQAAAAARAKMAASTKQVPAKFKTYRKFTPKTGVKTPARAPRKVCPAGYYKVYLDGEVLVDALMSKQYIDETDKAPGEHTYKVAYVDAASAAESDPAEVTVTIEEPVCNPPTNFKLSYTYDEENGTYSTLITWEAPEGPRKPIYYEVFSNGEQIAYEYTEYEFGQTMLPKGIVNYSVSAHYQYPDGDSELVTDELAIATRYWVRNYTATLDNGNVNLKWDAPKAEEGCKVASYDVYRGNEQLATGLKETAYTDTNAPAGVYDYSVFAVYDDGVKSPKQSKRIENGMAEAYPLPFYEDFEGGMTPENWSVDREYGTSKEAYLWRFDNFFELDIQGGGFAGDFASINTERTGYVMIRATLTTPPISTDITSGDKLYLTFDLDMLSDKGVENALSYSKDGGETWVEYEIMPSYKQKDLEEGQTCRPENLKFDITELADGTPVMFRWEYYGLADGHMAIDNVKVFVENTDAIAGVSTGKSSLSMTEGQLNATADTAIRSMEVIAVNGVRAAFANGNGTNSISIDTSALPHGAYIVRLTTDNDTTTHKVLVK